MTKKKTQAPPGPSLESILERPVCYYCNKDFEHELNLHDHQKKKHFGCPQCTKRLNTAGGLQIHVNNVHKSKIEKVSGAIAGREGIEPEIFGMQGFPPALLAHHKQQVTEEYFRQMTPEMLAAYNKARDGGQQQANQSQAANQQTEAKKPKIDDMEDVRMKAAAVKARIEAKRAKKAAEANATNSGEDTKVDATKAIEPKDGDEVSGAPAPAAQHIGSIVEDQASNAPASAAPPKGKGKAEQQPADGLASMTPAETVKTPEEWADEILGSIVLPEVPASMKPPEVESEADEQPSNALGATPPSEPSSTRVLNVRGYGDSFVPGGGEPTQLKEETRAKLRAMKHKFEAKLLADWPPGLDIDHFRLASDKLLENPELLILLSQMNVVLRDGTRNPYAELTLVNGSYSVHSSPGDSHPWTDHSEFMQLLPSQKLDKHFRIHVPSQRFSGPATYYPGSSPPLAPKRMRRDQIRDKRRRSLPDNTPDAPRTNTERIGDKAAMDFKKATGHRPGALPPWETAASLAAKLAPLNSALATSEKPTIPSTSVGVSAAYDPAVRSDDELVAVDLKGDPSLTVGVSSANTTTAPLHVTREPSLSPVVSAANKRTAPEEPPLQPPKKMAKKIKKNKNKRTVYMYGDGNAKIMPEIMRARSGKYPEYRSIIETHGKEGKVEEVPVFKGFGTDRKAKFGVLRTEF